MGKLLSQSVSSVCFFLFCFFRNQCCSALMCRYIGKKSWLCVFPKGKRKRPRNCTNLLLLSRLIEDAVVPLSHHYSICPVAVVDICSAALRILAVMYFLPEDDAFVLFFLIYSALFSWSVWLQRRFPQRCSSFRDESFIIYWHTMH